MREIILESYEEFFNDHPDLISESTRLQEVITDDTIFEEYRENLLNNLDVDASTRNLISEMFDIHRSQIISEASTMLGTPDAIAYSVASFPLILDMYVDDLLAKGVYVKPSNVPQMTLTRLRVVAEKIDVDGNTKKVIIPNVEEDLRNSKISVELTNGKRANLFTEKNISKNDYSISAKGMRIVSVKAVLDGDANTEQEFDVPNCVFDSRGNVVCDDFEIDFGNGNKAVVELTGSINKESGSITVNGNVLSKEGDKEISVTKIKLVFRVFAQGGSKAVVKIKPSAQSIDIVADADETYEISEVREIVQNWQSIYNKNILNELSAVTKTQIQINKNFEIADLLEASEYAMKKAGTYRVYDVLGNSKLAPTKISDLFANVVPVILQVAKAVTKKGGLKPNVLYAGSDVAVVLEALQDFVSNMSSEPKTLGVASSIADIRKFTIVSSAALPNNKVYIGRKGVSENDSSIVDLAYKPLYIIPEVTGGKDITHLRSRTRAEVARIESLGCVELKNVDSILGLA